MTKTKILFFLILWSILTVSYGQKKEKQPKVEVRLNLDEGIYNAQDSLFFLITVTDISEKDKLTYEIGPEKMPPQTEGSLPSISGTYKVYGGKGFTPGFIRCKVTHLSQGQKTYHTVTAAIEPNRIMPKVERPADFHAFWQKKIKEISPEPLNTEFTPLLNYSNDSIGVFQVKYQISKKEGYFYGILSLPKKSEKLPALIRFPGAGIYPPRPEMQMAQHGVITLSIYIHNYPVTLEKDFYTNLEKSTLKEYQYFGIEDRDHFYYNRVIAGCIKAVDLMYSLPEFDKERLAVWGSSQGGALSIITASLEKRVKRLAAFCPGMCDFSGYLYGRPGAWPDFYNSTTNIGKAEKERVYKSVLPYYDVVNFAKDLKTSGFYSWGFNDQTTPPTAIYTAYNAIEAPKEVFIIPNGEHKIYPEQVKKMNEWFLEYFDLDPK
ncbi:MAG: acetylxylan esterase [Petrimonas sp.]|jgi:cephalosporin-C deacetylase-like acetyl esterase|uniref:acetylxylan esterase n=2 Tax=Petrimonas TaxID=307628 RepID=UPI000E8F445C|nr:acetylxylan esterase [Petrimonas sp.]HAC74084.1 acetylxylan esterase [Porphyromonadaceae bacterium]MEA5071378.1 acetylxylan esterase [Petrimonas sp.]HBK94138.1 acetylxylan esterase [Porphyromonadaceae bacterium]HBU45427.1 acetylxylan esterase [Porphyromonadaceae bacterium]